MARGKPFAVLPVDEKSLVKQVDVVQRNVRDAFDQLEDARRGMLISTVLAVPSSQVLSEQLTVVYTGKGGDTLRLPSANLRGGGRSQILLVANQGTGTVTLVSSGNDTLNGAASVPVNGTAVLWSDGATKWHEVSALSLPGVGPGAGLVGGSGIASITLDAQGRVVAVGTASYVVTARSLIATADITLDGGAGATVDLSANRTMGLANAGAGAGAIGTTGTVIQTFTLDGKGRVIAGTATATPDVSRYEARQGTALVAGDFALSAGWGSTASVSTVTTGSRDPRGEIIVASAGVGQALNPTITLTFKNGAWPAAPFAIVTRNGGSQPTVINTWTTTTTTLVIIFNGTPVAGQNYQFVYMVLG